MGLLRDAFATSQNFPGEPVSRNRWFFASLRSSGSAQAHQAGGAACRALPKEAAQVEEAKVLSYLGLLAVP